MICKGASLLLLIFFITACDYQTELSIQSNPDGASIYLDGEFIGLTPLTKEVRSKDSAVLHVTNGLRGAKRIIELKPGTKEGLYLELGLAKVVKKESGQNTASRSTIKDLIVLPNGDLFLVGDILDYWSSHGSSTVWMQVLNQKDLSAKWVKALVNKSIASKPVSNAFLTEDGHILIVGHIDYAFHRYLSHIRMSKVSIDGTVLWDKRFNTTLIPNYKNDEVFDSYQTPDGEILILGWSDVRPWLIKVSGSGKIIWQTYLEHKNEKTITGIPLATRYDSQKGHALAYVHSGSDILIKKVNNKGNVIDSKSVSLGVTPYMNVDHGVVDEENNLFVSGRRHVNVEDTTPFILKISSNGEFIYQQHFERALESGGIVSLELIPGSREVIFSGESRGKEFMGELNNSGDIKWLQFEGYIGYEKTSVIKKESSIYELKALANSKLKVIRSRVHLSSDTLKREYHSDPFFAEILKNNQRTSSVESNKIASTNGASSDTGNLHVTVIEDSFLGQYELDSYHVKIVREKELNGRYVFDEEEEYQYNGGFLDDSPHFYTIAHGYYKIEFYGLTVGGNKKVLGTVTNVKHIKNSNVEVQLGSSTADVSYF